MTELSTGSWDGTKEQVGEGRLMRFGKASVEVDILEWVKDVYDVRDLRQEKVSGVKIRFEIVWLLLGFFRYD